MAGRGVGRYPPEYKEQMVELVRPGRSPGSLAREFEPSEQTIRNWVKQADLDEGRRSDGLTTEARVELLRLKRENKRLRMERDILKRAAAWFARESGSDPQRGYAFMKANEAAFPVAAMCRVLDLSPSGYYGWLKRPPSARARRDAELKDRIMAIWSDNGEICGCPRIHAVLLGQGERVGRKRVARLMRELGIEGVTRRRFKTATTRKDAKARPAPDLADRDFSAGGPRPAVGCRHHLRAHVGRLAVPRGRPRCLEPPDCRLGDGAAHAGRTGRERAGDGDLAPTAEGTGHSSFGQ